MAGGTSIWASKDARTDPKQIFNGRLLYLLVTLAWAGCFYGFDSGNIGGILTLPSFENAFGLSGLSQEAVDAKSGTIAAMLAAGGSAGALCAWPTSDFLGRKWSVFLWGIVFLIGAVMQMIADYDTLLAGRFIGGMGVGASSMLSPQFLAENAPKSVRGSMTATYNLMIVFSLALAFWINYSVSLWHNAEHNDTQWRLAMGIQLIPGAFMCLMIPFIPETPRYMINRGKSQQGLKNLTALRKLPADHPYIQTEYQEIEAQVRFEQEAHQGHNVWTIIQDIYGNKSNSRRFFLAVMLFLFHKFAGTDSLNYYAPSIFKLIGVKGNSNTLLTTGVYGIVKFVTTIFYVAYLVDRIGRRLPLLIVDYGITKATPVMLSEMGWGTFLLYSMLTYGGVVFIYFCLPEMKGRSIESMDDLFSRPLWTMFRHAYPTEEEKIRHDVQDMIHAGKLERGDSTVDKGGAAVHIESASDR
ncbi:hypothetical protein CBER1_07606 [Cercospora berteroae]|uniref:Major facilitator superfamily (MFS) profile domain-containing protein n=1 Tax=Cercospora berteroae TaxID=357750 RepID=A0A2S6BTW2_9PEZI|nr:hypothetical protein CBER1_07606 [Cercospora berteroae]